MIFGQDTLDLFVAVKIQLLIFHCSGVGNGSVDGSRRMAVEKGGENFVRQRFLAVASLESPFIFRKDCTPINKKKRKRPPITIAMITRI